MESAVSLQYYTLINELTQGMEKTKQLRFYLWSTSLSEAQDVLLQEMLSSYDKALLILKGGITNGQAGMAYTTAAMHIPESSVSVDGSLRSEDFNKNIKDSQNNTSAAKKQKTQPTWTEQVRVNSENGLEGPTDDGYSWRKYGQKYILGAKYPRSYYRCTYQIVQNCWATKQVQRSDDDLTVFDITYKGRHSCNQSTNSVPPSASPERQELKLKKGHNLQGQQNHTLSNIKANLRGSTENLGEEEMPAEFSFPSTFASHDKDNRYFPNALLDGSHHQGGTISPQFSSPATSETSYIRTVTYGMTPNIWHSEVYTADIISAHALTTNSPLGGTEFSIGPIDQDPNFPFNMSECFTFSNFEHGQE